MIEVFDRALRSDPLEATLQAFRGWGLQTLGRLDEAEATYARARSLDPGNPAGYYTAGGLALDARGDAVEALRLLRRSSEVDPADPELFSWRAHAGLSIGEYDAAVFDSGRAVELGPSNGLSLATRALTHIHVGEEAEAFRLAKQGLEPNILQRFGSRLLLLRILRISWLRESRLAEAIRAYEDAYPSVAQGASLFSAPLENPQFGGFGELVGAALDLACLRQASGDDSGSSALVHLVRTSLDRQPAMEFLRLFGPGTAKARMAMLEGRHPEALQSLKNVVDGGWIANWRFSLEHDPVWDPIRQESDFSRIISVLEERAQAQRHRLHASGDL